MIVRTAPLLAVLVAMAAPMAGPALAQSNAPATGGAEAAKVLELEGEIRRLNGRIEQLEFKLRQIAEDATRRIGDLDYRVTVLEGGDASLLGDPTPLGQAGGPPASGGDGAAPPAAISERDTLDKAIAAVQGAEYDKARQMLEDFMASYSDGPLVGEAEYWLGETYYREGDWRRAATTFLANVTNRAPHDETPSAFLHLGMSLDRLGHTAEACQTFGEILRRNFENAAVVDEAKAQRQRLACP